MVATRVETPAHQPSERFSIMPVRHRKKKMCAELKVIMLGNAGVGKTSLLEAMTAKAASGVDFRVCMATVNDEIVKMQLWDTAGQEKHAMLPAAYYRRARGVVLVYDACDRQSFRDVVHWAKQVQTYGDASEPMSVVVVANHSSEGPVVVPSVYGRALATLLDAVFVENQDWMTPTVWLDQLIHSLGSEKTWRPDLEAISSRLETLCVVAKPEPVDDVDSATESESEDSDLETTNEEVSPVVATLPTRRNSKLFVALELGNAASATTVAWNSSRERQRMALVGGCLLMSVCPVALLVLHDPEVLGGAFGWLKTLAVGAVAAP